MLLRYRNTGINFKIIVIFIPLLIYFSCSVPKEIQTENKGQTQNDSPQFKYAGIFLDHDIGVKAKDQSIRLDSLLIRTEGSFYVKALSPSRDKMAIAYKTFDSLKISLITFNPMTINHISSSKKENQVALAWKDDNVTLFFNYYGWKKVGNKTYPKNIGSYYYRTDSLKLNFLKFANGSIIEKWLPTGFLVTSYGETYYLIDFKKGKAM